MSGHNLEKDSVMHHEDARQAGLFAGRTTGGLGEKAMDDPEEKAIFYSEAGDTPFGSVAPDGLRAAFTRYEPEDKAMKKLDSRINLKLDLSMVVILGLGFMFSGIDKTNIGNAATTNFIADANLGPEDVGNATSLFAAPFVVLQPVAVILSRIVGPKWWIASMLVLWGGIAMAHAAISSRGSLIALRILLGAAEAGWYPASVYYISNFYPRKYIAVRIAVISLVFTAGSGFSGLLAYGILSTLKSPLHDWQYLFLIDGAVTVFLGILAFILFPKTLSNAWCLNQAERDHAVYRLRTDLGVNAELDRHGNLHAGRTITRQDWKDAVKDWPKIILMFCNVCIVLPVNAFGVFLPLMLQGMGYKGIEANLMTVPPFLIGSFVAWILIIISDRTQKRGIFAILGNALSMIGLIVMISSTNSKLRYAFTNICLIGAFTPAPIVLAWMVANTPSAGKRSVILGLNGLSNVASVIGGQVYKKQKYQPLYKIPLSITLGLVALATIGFAGISFYYRHNNQQREQILNNMSAEQLQAEALKKGEKSAKFSYTT